MRRRRLRRILYVLLGIVVVVVIAGVVAVHAWLGQPSTGPGAKTPTGNVPYNILLIGNNARQATGPLSMGTSGGLADILMVAHIDPQKHRVTLISVPRDTLYALPQWNDPIPKIKETFFLGLQQKDPVQGPVLAMKAVSRMTGLPISAYIVTDFQGFSDAINAIGGIDLCIPYKIVDARHLNFVLNAGCHHLTGAVALAYIRVRQNAAGNGYRTNDFQRMGAEQQVILALKDKLLKDPVQAAVHLPALLAAWRKDVATNLTNQQLMQLGLMAAHSHIARITIGSLADSMRLASMPLQGFNHENYITGAYYDVLNAANIYTTLKPYGSTGAWTGLQPFPQPKTVQVAVEGSSYYAYLLQKKGFTATVTSTSCGCSGVTVTFPPGQFLQGVMVAKVVGNSNAYVTPGNVSQVTVQGP